MSSNVKSEEINIRKIEDIIDIQKANGNINVRQVVFNLPSKTDSTISASLAKSLETRLVKSERSKTKGKKVRHKRRKCSLPDIASWPSDSDITVLQMKLCLSNDFKKKVGTVTPGDGLHQQDSSSMVNLATLILKSQPPSKQSLKEEYLLPITSWENAIESETKNVKVNSDLEENKANFKTAYQVLEATCSQHGTEHFYSDKNESKVNDVSTKAKVARFLRLYFCPCCTCLYKMEQTAMREDASAYCTNKLHT